MDPTQHDAHLTSYLSRKHVATPPATPTTTTTATPRPSPHSRHKRPIRSTPTKCTATITKIHFAHLLGVCGDRDGDVSAVLTAVFRMLSVEDAITCSSVCWRWNDVASQDALWKYLSHRDFIKVTPPTDVATTWKRHYMNTMMLQRRKAVAILCKRCDPYTAMPNVRDVLKSLSTKFFLQIAHVEGPPSRRFIADAVEFNRTSLVLVWHKMSEQLDGAETLNVIASSLLKVIPKKPKTTECETRLSKQRCRSLVLKTTKRDLATHTTHFTTNDIYCVGDDELLFGRWSDGSACFVWACLHYDALISRLLGGSESSCFVKQPRKSYDDDVDCVYGLHSFSILLEIRGGVHGKNVVFSHNFDKVDCLNGRDVSTIVKHGIKHARFVLLGDTRVEKMTLTGAIELEWMSGAISSNVPKTVLVDVTTRDEHGEIFLAEIAVEF